jgi:transposase
MREDVITITLGLPEFRVLRVKESCHRIEVWVEKMTTSEACPGCGHFSDQGYDERWDDIWDQPLWDKGVQLWVRKRRFSCVYLLCSYYQQDKPFAQLYGSFGFNHRRTYRFDRYIYRLAKRMAHTDVVKELALCHTPISDNTVGRIYHRLGQAELAGYQPGRLVAIGIDEYSVWRGHRYATIITDPIHHRVIETFLGRDKETVVAHLLALFPPESIKLAVMDMHGGYENAVLTAFPRWLWMLLMPLVSGFNVSALRAKVVVFLSYASCYVRLVKIWMMKAKPSWLSSLLKNLIYRSLTTLRKTFEIGIG